MNAGATCVIGYADDIGVAVSEARSLFQIQVGSAQSSKKVELEGNNFKVTMCTID
jgi:hypothetical protein